jgi:hypothetical protein
LKRLRKKAEVPERLVKNHPSVAKAMSFYWPIGTAEAVLFQNFDSTAFFRRL